MKKYLFTFFVSLSFSSACFANNYLTCWNEGDFQYTKFVEFSSTQPYIDIGLISQGYGDTIVRGIWDDGTFLTDYTFASNDDAKKFCVALKSLCKKVWGANAGGFQVGGSYVYVFWKDAPKINCDTLLLP